MKVSSENIKTLGYENDIISTRIPQKQKSQKTEYQQRKCSLQVDMQFIYGLGLNNSIQKLCHLCEVAIRSTLQLEACCLSTAELSDFVLCQGVSTNFTKPLYHRAQRSCSVTNKTNKAQFPLDVHLIFFQLFVAVVSALPSNALKTFFPALTSFLPYSLTLHFVSFMHVKHILRFLLNNHWSSDM